MEDNQNTSKSFSNIPSSSAEVKIRTMKSDIESFKESGGSSPQFAKVKVAGLSIDPPISKESVFSDQAESVSENHSSQQKNEVVETNNKKSGNFFGKFILTLFILLIFGGIGFFAYTKFFSNKNSLPSNNSGAAQNNAVNSGAYSSSSQSNVVPISLNPTSTSIVTPTVLSNHVSLFKIAPDANVTFLLSSSNSVNSASDLETYSQKLLNALSSVNKKSSFIEITVKNSDGTYLNIGDLFSNAGINFFDQNFLFSNFNPDASFFVYKDKNGNFWPGYVLSTLQNVNSNLISSVANDIESSQSINNIFINGSWNMASSGFSNLIISSDTLRAVNFTGNGQSAFVYGWVNNDLIISSSRDGFVQAMKHL
jgi:hypothetical protein